jgi:hypothetical protein
VNGKNRNPVPFRDIERNTTKPKTMAKFALYEHESRSAAPPAARAGASALTTPFVLGLGAWFLVMFAIGCLMLTG